jgi:hypothetical protein
MDAGSSKGVSMQTLMKALGYEFKNPALLR